MNLGQSFLLAFSNIMSSKVRSILTMLGIIIGVAAVIVIVGLGNGLQIYMTESFQSMGTNLLTVSITGRGSTRSVSADDMYALAEENYEFFESVSPSVSVGQQVKIGSETLSYSSITGVGEDYLSMRKYEMSIGRFLQYIDMANRHKVCVIGSYINNEWFSGNGVGQTLKIGGVTYKIVGVMAEIADSTERSTDDTILIPYSTAAKQIGSSSISSYSFAMITEDNVAVSKAIIEDYLNGVFGSTNAYRIVSMSEMLDTMSEMLNIMITILSAIAAISLVVGGIGIMNIMLVSVSERTKEIGIRKALGAKQRQIMSQFVIEAGTTSAIGGMLGIVLGFLLSMAATQIIVIMLEENLTVSPSASSVMTAFLISAGIGVLFGYLPAKKAARLNPIDALRYE